MTIGRSFAAETEGSGVCVQVGTCEADVWQLLTSVVSGIFLSPFSVLIKNTQLIKASRARDGHKNEKISKVSPRLVLKKLVHKAGYLPIQNSK